MAQADHHVRIAEASAVSGHKRAARAKINRQHPGLGRRSKSAAAAWLVRLTLCPSCS